MNIRNEILEPNAYYHIYNRGINSGQIFNTEENYLFFLSKFDKYLSSVCDVLAYCLMPNHFHFLIKVKSSEDLETFYKVPNFDKGAQENLGNVPSKTFVKVLNFDKGAQDFDKVGNEIFVKVQNSNKDAQKRNGNIASETFVKVPNFDKGVRENAKGLHATDAIVSKQIGKFISSYSQAYNKVTNRHGALLESPFKRKRIDSEEYLKNLIIYIHQNPNDLKKKFESYKFSSYQAILSTAKTNVLRQGVLDVFDGLENFIYCHQQEQKIDFEL